MRTPILAAVLCLTLSGKAWAQVAAFVAPPETVGSLTVRLHPMENVTTSAPRLVTFGVPFTRGSIATAGLAKLRVLKGGVEVPAFVESLTPWRHINDPAKDGTSVRVARVQIQYGFAARYPAFEEVTIEWGLNDRLQNVATFQNPRLGWHDVTTGSFTTGDGVQEPDVYAVFPKSHLVKGVLRPMRMSPMDDSVPEAREDPNVMDATEQWPGQVELDHASKNNMYTVINEDAPGLPAGVLCPYKTDSEPWLYDRASTMFVVYMRSGYLKALREAVRHAEFYRTQLYPAGTTPAAAVGCFKLKSPNPADYIGSNGSMYAYDESLAYLHWLTGDTQALTAIPWVVNCHELSGDEPVHWTPTTGGWNERHSAFRLLASVVAYEVLGGEPYKTRVTTYTGDFVWHQNGAGGQIPAQRLDGAVYHYGSQHGDGTANALVASSWMEVLLSDAMVRAYAFTEDANVARFVKRLGQWEKGALTFDTAYLYDWTGPLYYPRYMIALDGTPDPLDGDDASEHSAEVAATIAWGDYFGRLLGEPDVSLTQRTRDVYFTFDVGVNYWIRPAAPPVNTAFRVTPWRKWGWEHRVSGSLSWLMEQNARALKGDADQDLKTDLYFRNVTNGQNRLWTMNGVQRVAETAITPNPASTAWQIAGVDDFDRDGKNDLAFWNSSTGAVEFWLMNGAARIGTPVPITNAPLLAPSWKLSATADFDADNKPDVLWRDFATQKIQLWTMNATARVATLTPVPDQAVDGNWEIVAALDYNNDGATDLLWYNATSGKIVLWYLDARLRRIAGLFTNPPNAGDNNWRVLAGGDYGLGAGPAVPGSKDIVWRNATSGNQVVWHMDFAGSRTSGEFTSPTAPAPALDWVLAGPR